MAFDIQVITTKGLNQLKALADNASYELRFTKCAVYAESIDLEHCYAGKFNDDTPLNSNELGFIWSVTPTEFYTPDNNLRVVARFQRKFSDNENYEGTVNLEKAKSFALWAELYTKEIDDLGNAVYTAILGSETLIAVASNETREIYIPQGLDHALYMTFSLIITNGFDRISAVSNGVALVGDLASLTKDNLKSLSLSFDANTRDLILKDNRGSVIDIANIPSSDSSGGIAAPYDSVLVKGNQTIQGVKSFTENPELDIRLMEIGDGFISVERPQLNQYVTTDEKGLDALSNYVFDSDTVVNGYSILEVEKPIAEDSDTADITYQKTSVARQAYFAALELWLTLKPSVSDGVSLSKDGITIISNNAVMLQADATGIALASYGIKPEENGLNLMYNNQTFLSMDDSGRIGGSSLCSVLVYFYLNASGSIESKVSFPKGFSANVSLSQSNNVVMIEDYLRDSSCNSSSADRQTILDNISMISIETCYSFWGNVFASNPMSEMPKFNIMSVWESVDDHRRLRIDINSIMSSFVYSTLTEATVVCLKLSVW